MNDMTLNVVRVGMALGTVLFCLLESGNVEADVFEDAPEAAEYILLYELPIPDQASFNYGSVPYSVDTTSEFKGGFDRVAYHLELEKPGEERYFVYVSIPAQVLKVEETGVPTTPSGVFLQGLVQDISVVSNHPQLQNLSSPLEGSIEFWPYNYTTGNGAGIAGASGDFYDSGDTSAGSGDYASMQMHVAGTNQTLFAFNCWGGGYGTIDLGIGNASPDENDHPDWTFAANADQYTTKTLRVLARPGSSATGLSATVESPQPRQVIQRQTGNTGTYLVSGTLNVPAEKMDGRILALDTEGKAGEEGEWEVVDEGPLGTTFSGAINAPAGWHRLELRVWKNNEPFDTIVVEPIGIGEVFITGGQSNSANSGGSLMSPEDPRVSAWGPGGWQVANDPQPIATGGGGTPWPVLGDLLVQRFDVPIGFISVGWGGTRVDQWLPFAPDGLYNRFLTALEEVGPSGARAILWHQGESDAYVGTSQDDYQNRLETVIQATRGDGGWTIPWGVARASFLPGLSPESMAAVIGGQNATIEADEHTFSGPETDDLIGPDWRYDEVHFNEAGLLEHAKRWNNVIELPPCQGFIADEDCDIDEDTTTSEEEPDTIGTEDIQEETDTIDSTDAGMQSDDTDVGEADITSDTAIEEAEETSPERSEEEDDPFEYPEYREGPDVQEQPDAGGTGVGNQYDASFYGIEDIPESTVLQSNQRDSGCGTTSGKPSLFGICLVLLAFKAVSRRSLLGFD